MTPLTRTPIFLITLLSSVLIVGACTSPLPKEPEHLYLENVQLDDVIATNEDTIPALEELRDRDKFGPQNYGNCPPGYLGFLPATDRPLANQKLNTSIDRIINLIASKPRVTKRMILDEFEKGLQSFDALSADTEDRERICYYYEDIMNILEMESSNELLNNWMY